MFFSEKKKMLRAVIDQAIILGLTAKDIEISEEFLEYNEEGLCLDHIIVQLHEFEIPITQEFYTLVESAAQKMKLPEKEYAYLKELIKDQE